jgi:EVE domain
MPLQRARTEAFIWQGNPDKWHDGEMSSDVAHNSQYIYWSTPQWRNEIRVGDKAYIWRAKGDGREGPPGIIATGTVAELPRQYLPNTRALFKHPERLDPGEEAASSKWKTGISISEVRLTPETGMLTAEILAPVSADLSILKMPRGTVFRINAEQCQKIEELWASNRGRA